MVGSLKRLAQYIVAVPFAVLAAVYGFAFAAFVIAGAALAVIFAIPVITLVIIAQHLWPDDVVSSAVKDFLERQAEERRKIGEKVGESVH